MYQEVGQDVFDLLIHLFGTRRIRSRAMGANFPKVQIVADVERSSHSSYLYRCMAVSLYR